MIKLKTLINTAILSSLMLSFSVFAEIAPDVLVKSTADDVLAIVKQDKDIQAGDQKKIYALAEEKIVPNFNLERVSRLVLGKNWLKATPIQQDAFKKEFRSLLMRTYAIALTKYKTQTIDYKPVRLQAGDTTATVKTLINQPSGPAIAVDYTLSKTGDAWKVYDIVIEGVSLVTNYRSQFSQEIRQNGIDSLIQKLVDKNKSAGA